MSSRFSRILLRVDHHPFHKRQNPPLHVVEQDRRVGQDDPLDRGVRDVALVPQRHVLECGLGVAAEDPGEPDDLL